MAELQGKTTLVTGATAGIGLAVARRFVEEGAHVVITGRRQGPLDEAVAELTRTRDGSVTGVRADVAELDDLDRVITAVTERGTGLDVIFANAGSGRFASLEEISWDHYASTFNTNVGGTIFTVQKALPLLTAGASIVLNSSNIDVKGSPSFSVYAATKAALRSFTRSWAAELADRGIRVNSVAPGPTATPGLSGLAPGATGADDLLAGMAAAVPMGRLARPVEIAEVVVFLAGERSSFMTGAEIYVDGGQSQI